MELFVVFFFKLEISIKAKEYEWKCRKLILWLFK